MYKNGQEMVVFLPWCVRCGGGGGGEGFRGPPTPQVMEFGEFGGPRKGKGGRKAFEHPELFLGAPSPSLPAMLGGFGGVEMCSTPKFPTPKLDSAPVGVFLSHGGVGGLLSRDLFHATAWGCQRGHKISPFSSSQKTLGGGVPAPPLLQVRSFGVPPGMGEVGGGHSPSPSSGISCTSSSSSRITTQSSPLSLGMGGG